MGLEFTLLEARERFARRFAETDSGLLVPQKYAETTRRAVLKAGAAAGLTALVSGCRTIPIAERNYLPELIPGIHDKEIEILADAKGKRVMMFGEAHPEDFADENRYEEKYVAIMLGYLRQLGFSLLGIEMPKKEASKSMQEFLESDGSEEAFKKFRADLMKDFHFAYIAEDGKINFYAPGTQLWMEDREDYKEYRDLKTVQYLTEADAMDTLVNAARKWGYDLICYDDLSRRPPMVRADLSPGRQIDCAENILEVIGDRNIVTFGGVGWLRSHGITLYRILTEFEGLTAARANLRLVGHPRYVEEDGITQVDDVPERLEKLKTA